VGPDAAILPVEMPRGVHQAQLSRMPIRGKIEKQCPLSVQIFGCVVLIQGQAMTTIFSKKQIHANS